MRFFIVLLLCTFTLSAQNSTPQNSICKVELGVKHSKDANESHSAVIPGKNNGFYLTKYKGMLMRDISIELYNEDLELYKTIETEFGGKNIRGHLMHYNDKFYCYSIHLDRKKNVYTFLKQELDPNTFEPVEDFIEIDKVGFNKRELMTTGIPISFANSSNGKNFITYKGVQDKKIIKPTVIVKGFDENLDFVWEREVDLPYNIDLYDCDLVSVADNGLLYFFGKVYKQKAKDRVKGEINFTYELFIYDPKTDKSKKCQLSLDDLFVNAVDFKFNEANNVICSGFYSKKGNYSIDGCFFMEINPETLEIVKKNVEEFSVDFLVQDVSTRQANSIERKEATGKDAEIPKFKIIKSFYNDDGSVVLVGEQRKIIEKARTNTNTKPGFSIQYVPKDYYYFFEDIVIVNLNAEGKIEWAQKIDKDQRTKNDGARASSFALQNTNGKYYFIYNDNPGYGLKLNGVRAEKSKVLITEIDENGNKKTEPLYTTKQVGLLTLPAYSYQVFDNQMLLYSISKTQYRFTRLTF